MNMPSRSNRSVIRHLILGLFAKFVIPPRCESLTHSNDQILRLVEHYTVLSFTPALRTSVPAYPFHRTGRNSAHVTYQRISICTIVYYKERKSSKQACKHSAVDRTIGNALCAKLNKREDDNVKAEHV